MADETRNANVVLTANVDQYSQATAMATKNTNALTDSINKLVASLDGITKRVGKKILLFSAADTAAMVAYTAAAAKHEKQLQTLRATTTLTNKSLDVYKKGIEGIARQMPIADAAVAQLVTQINKLGVTSERQALSMARTFTRLSAATGEDVNALTQGLIELSRQMGTLGNGAQGVNNFADSLTTISTKAGVSATSVLQFAQSIAPMARAAGIGQKELLGISTAFSKAGQDGFAAANTFNTIINDITRATQSGSPELGKYASAIGMTVEQFKQLDAGEQFIQIVEAVSKAGPQASKMLDRLGIDGVRAAKSIQGLANEAGGLRKAVNDAVGAYGNGATEKGAAAAFSGLDNEMTKFRNNLEQIAATIGSALLPVATKFMEIINATLDAVNRLAGPLLVVAGAIGGILAPVSAALGGLMTIMGPLSSLMIAMTMFRLSPIRAMFQGVKEGAAMNASRAAGVPWVPTTSAGRRMAPGGGGMPIFRSAPYNLGQRIGGRIQPTNVETLVARSEQGVGRLAPGAMGPAMPTARDIPPNRLGQLALRGGIGASNLTRTWYIDPTKQLISNAAMADPMNRVSPIGNAIDSGYRQVGALRAAWADPRGYLASLRSPMTAAPAVDHVGQAEAARTAARAKATGLFDAKTVDRIGDKAYADSMTKTTAAANASAVASKVSAAESRTASLGMKDLGKSALNTSRAMAGLPLAYGRMGASLAMQGAGRVGAGLLGTVGGLVGGGATTGGVLIGAAALAFATKTAMDSTKSTFDPDRVRNITATNEALGIAVPPIKSFAQAVSDADMRLRRLGAGGDKNGFFLTPSERGSALSGEYTDSRFADLRGPKQARAYIGTMGPLSLDQRISLGKDAWKFAKGNQGVYNQITSGLGKDFQYGGAAETLMAGAQETQADTWHNKVFGAVGSSLPFVGPWMKGAGSPFADNGAREQVTAAINAIDAQSADVLGDKGNQAGGQTLAVELMKAADKIFADTSDAGMLMQQNFLDSVEQAFTEGQDLGVGRNMLTGANSLSGVDMRGGASFMEGLRNSAEGSVARGLYAQFFGAETSSTSAAQKNLDAILATNPMSDIEKQIQSTDFGKFVRNSDVVKYATEGGGTEDPKAINAAFEQMLANVTDSGTSFDDVTTTIQKFKTSLEDTTNFTYTLAQAVQAAAERMGGIQARREGGYVGDVAFRAQTIADKMANPDQRLAGESYDSLRQQREGIQQEVIGKKVEAYQTVRGYNIGISRNKKSYDTQLEYFNEDYALQASRANDDWQLSMVRSREDFARSMARASEDAAKAMYDPFLRVTNPGSASASAILGNMKEQNDMIEEQVKNLARARKMGLSQQAIDMMDLANPQNAFQLERIVEEGNQDFSGINAQAKRKAKGVTALTGESVGTRRAYEDQNRAIARAEKDREKAVTRMEHDHAKALARMAHAQTVQLRQALWDLNQYTKDLTIKEGEIDKLLSDQVKTALDTASAAVRKAVDSDVLYLETTLARLTNAANVPIPSSGEPHAAQRPTGANQKPGDLNTNGMTTDPYSQNQTPGASDGYKPWAGPARDPRDNKWGVDPSKVPYLAKGGYIDGPTLAGLAENGAEFVWPLTGEGGQRAATMVAQQITREMVKGLGANGHATRATFKGGGSVTISNTTNFNVAKIEAQDVNDMARQLKEREKLTRMRQGANAKS